MMACRVRNLGRLQISADKHGHQFHGCLQEDRLPPKSEAPTRRDPLVVSCRRLTQLVAAFGPAKSR